MTEPATSTGLWRGIRWALLIELAIGLLVWLWL